MKPFRDTDSSFKNMGIFGKLLITEQKMSNNFKSRFKHDDFLLFYEIFWFKRTHL